MQRAWMAYMESNESWRDAIIFKSNGWYLISAWLSGYEKGACILTVAKIWFTMKIRSVFFCCFSALKQERKGANSLTLNLANKAMTDPNQLISMHQYPTRNSVLFMKKIKGMNGAVKIIGKKRKMNTESSLFVLMLCFLLLAGSSLTRAKAQSAEVQQLLLDVTKLSQFKQILTDLKCSYEILDKGYNTIKNIASGNFSLHEAFIDGLLLVNPALAKYRRVADIISDELGLVSRYKQAYAYFKTSGRFREAELNYMIRVYKNLVDKSVDNLNALTIILTAGKIRMSDDERIMEINRLYHDTHHMLAFMLDFNNKVAAMARQRGGLLKEAAGALRLQGLDK